MSTPEPGWYDDGHGALRWWDGSGWTAEVAAPVPARAEPGSGPGILPADVGIIPEDAEANRPSGGRRRRLIAIGAGVGVLAVGAVVVGLLVNRPLPAEGESAPVGDEDAAVAAVRALGDAWADADCESMLESTTVSYRERAALSDCSVFEAAAEEFSAGSERYRVTVGSVRADDDGVRVETTETYTGGEADGTVAVEVASSYRYVVVPAATGSRWMVDDVVPLGVPAEATGEATAEPDEADDPVDAEPDPSGSPQAEVPEEALAPIIAYDQAFHEIDCRLIESAATEDFLERVGIDDCGTFTAAAQGRAVVLPTNLWTPQGALATGRGTMTVDTANVVESLVDEDGNRVDAPVVLSYDFRWHLVRSGGTWMVDDVHDVSDGRVENTLTAEEEDAAEVTMERWRQAYAHGDCAAAEASSIRSFREALGWTDCDAIARQVGDGDVDCKKDLVPDEMRYRSRLDSLQGSIFADVVQTCTYTTDSAGNPLEEPYVKGTPYRYRLVKVDGTWLIVDGNAEGPAAEDEPSNANETAAVAAILAWNTGWRDGDCDAVQEAATPSMLSAMGVSSCSSFAVAADDFRANWAFLDQVSSDIERPGPAEMSIKVREDYDALIDDVGEPLDPPIRDEQYWVYTVIRDDDGVWRVDDSQPLG